MADEIYTLKPPENGNDETDPDPPAIGAISADDSLSTSIDLTPTAQRPVVA